MAFDSGPVSLTICQLPKALPKEPHKLFNERWAQALDDVVDEPDTGWVSGRHLLETRIDDETAYAGGYLHLHLRTAQRKIPPSLFKAQCRLEELAVMQESKSHFINRKQRKEIRLGVAEQMLKKMPPTITGTPFVVDHTTGYLYVGATSPGQIENFVLHFYETVHFEPIPLTPEMIARELFTENPDHLLVLDFSPRSGKGEPDPCLGRDFLTWLWFFQEKRGGTFTVPDVGEFGVLIDGPLVLAAMNPESTETVIRKGQPTISAEAAVALADGKKLRQAKLTLARGNENWVFTLDADRFTIRGLALPPGEQLEPHGHFQERMLFLNMLRLSLLRLFEMFIGELTDSEKAPLLPRALQQWVEEIQSR